MRLAPILLILVQPGWLGAQAMPGACNPTESHVRIMGRLADQTTGAPLQGATITFTWNAMRERLTRQVSTNRYGRYSFCDAPEDTRVSVRFSFLGQQAGTAVMVEESQGSTDVDVVLDSPHAKLTGRVTNRADGDPVSGASVNLGTEGLIARTGADGTFRLENVPPGRYTVEISRDGFVSVTDSVRVDLGGTTNLSARLGTSEFALEGIDVAVRSRQLEVVGFYERQERGLGTFLTREDIEEARAFIPSDILRRLPGIRVVPREFGPGFRLIGRNACPVQYILDGNRVGDVFNADDLEVQWIEAMEIYRGVSTLPTYFASLLMAMRDVDCGVIAIWTRVRDAQ